MNVRSSFPAGASDQTIAEALRAPLLASALPGDADSLADHEIDRIVDFIADTASRRAPGEPALRLLSSGLTIDGERRMRLAVINDDMPFLVDSVAQAIAAHGLDISRLLHPVVSVRRDASGKLVAILPDSADGERRESMI